MRHLPNIITVLRLASLPYNAYLMLSGRFYPALFFFFFSSSSDWLDGYLARRFSWQSRFGAIADPIADKGLVILAYVCMAIQGAVPMWLAALVLSRDLLILLFAGGALAFTRLRDFPPSQWGKWSTGFQMLAIGAALTHHSDVWRVPLWLFFATAAVFTVISGLHYLVTGIARLRMA